MDDPEGSPLAIPRWLLDQNFPPATFDAAGLDHGVEYVNLSSAYPELSAHSTPDWQLYLAAACGGFTGLVTSDASQVTQDLELIALTVSRVNVITWRGGSTDPVTLWGQLLAYMPEIQRHVDQERPHVFFIPTPRLTVGQGVRRPSDLARGKERHDHVSYRERHSSAVAAMARMLEPVDGRDDWRALLETAGGLDG